MVGHILKGDLCLEGNPGVDCNLDQRRPIYQYNSAERASVTGGYVYRGTEIPSLYGKYVYGDYLSGKVWAYSLESNENIELDVGGRNLSAFGEANNGEVFAVRYSNQGIVEKLVVDTGGVSDYPTRLSETGCVDPADPTQVTPGVIPSDVAQPFWSDGVVKERYLAVPDGERIFVDADGDWIFPPGAVTIKNFRNNGKLFETRFFVRHADGSYGGYTYEWNEAQTEAFWCLPQANPRISLGSQPWIGPIPAVGCFACHTDVAGGHLGPETRQLNTDMMYPATGRTANQFLTMDALGFLVGNRSPMTPFPAVTDGVASLDERGKSYLHVNCSNCHQPGGPGRGAFDARYETPFAEMSLCNQTPTLGDMGAPGARLVSPGDPARSVIYLRMSQRDDGAMPPLASAIPDEDGAGLLWDWFTSMSTCP